MASYDAAVAKCVADGIAKMTVSVYACPKHPSAESNARESCPMMDCDDKMEKVDRPIARASVAGDKAKQVEVTLGMDRAIRLSEVRKVVEANAGKVDDANLRLWSPTLIVVQPGAGAPCPMTLYDALKKIDGIKEIGTASVSEDKKTILILVAPAAGKGVPLADLQRALAEAKLMPVDVEWGRPAQDATVVECPDCRK